MGKREWMDADHGGTAVATNPELDAAVEEFINPYCRHGNIHAFCAYSPEQEVFCSSDAFEVFFGGAAGPGKTVVLANEGLRQVDKVGYRAIFFRRTYDELDQVVEMTHETFPRLNGRFNKQEMKWSFGQRGKSAHAQVMRSSRAISTFILRYCERDIHKLRHQGRAYAYIAWDELTQYPNDSVYTYLFFRCRPLWQGQNVKCYIRTASNPGGPGHAWVKERFIEAREDQRIYWEVVEDPISGRKKYYTRQFIKALLDSNDILMNTTDYETMLLAYPDPELRKAMRWADWDIVAGVMFSELREAVHRVEARDPLDWTAKEITIDYGYGGFTHVLWVETTTGIDSAPRSWVYRELVVKELPPPLIAQMISERTPVTEDIGVVTCDTNAWGTHDGGPPPIEQMMPHFRPRKWSIQPAVKGPGSRPNGWRLLHTYFFPRRQGGPLLRVMNNCPVLWHQLTSLARGIEPHDVEDIEPHQVDHGADALRYWAQRRPRPAPPTAADILATDPDLDKMGDPRSYEAAQIERLRKLKFPAVPVRSPKRKLPRPRKPW